MSRYRAYSEYQDTGLEWLESAPKHWQLFQGKRIFGNYREQAFENDEQLAASQKFGVVPQTLMMELNDSKVMLALKGTSSFRHVDKDDFVISLRSFEGGIEHSAFNGCVSPAYTVLRATKNISPNYYRHLFKSRPYISALQATTDSLRDGKSISFDQFGAIGLILPPQPEQEKIANFLDHETAKIDTLIAKQQGLIKLLKEKRQAVISHAVTKGLNPNAPTRDSGVEWLGEVPAHWSVSSIGYHAQISTGATPDRTNSEYWNGNIPWIKTGEVRYDEIFETEEYITELAISNSSVKISPPGTLLMAMYGQGVTRGRVAILGVPATYNQACAAINASERFFNQYLRYYFMAAYHAIRDGGNETSQMNLNADIVGKFKVTIPNIEEQYQIVEFLDKSLKKLDILLEQALSAIDFIQERRTALISAAVTGKIDVRDWQPAQNPELEGAAA
jgi:type I restriction enzyme S subunit